MKQQKNNRGIFTTLLSIDVSIYIKYYILNENYKIHHMQNLRAVKKPSPHFAVPPKLLLYTLNMQLPLTSRIN